MADAQAGPSMMSAPLFFLAFTLAILAFFAGEVSAYTCHSYDRCACSDATNAEDCTSGNYGAGANRTLPCCVNSDSRGQFESCEDPCPDSTVMDTMCPTMAGCGDPHFIGGNGVRYDFHGVPGKAFCIIADKTFHLNAHFIGQDGSKTGEDGTWMSKLGLVFAEGTTSHTLKLELVSGDILSDPDHVDTFVVEYDGIPVEVPAPKSGSSSWTSSDHLITLSRDANSLAGMSVDIQGHFSGRIVASAHEFPDGHHIDFEVSQMNMTDFVHGVLGQTFQPDRLQMLASSDDKHRDALDVVEGFDNNYISSDLLATDCYFARYEVPIAQLITTRRLLLGVGADMLSAHAFSCKDHGEGFLSCLVNM